MTNTRNNLDLIKNKSETENVQESGWSTLLPKLLKLVMSLLIVKDNICASVVCRAWYKASVSIRMKDRHLWLVKYPFASRTFELYDPSQDMSYTMKFPAEIQNMMVCYSKDGWLLMRCDHSSKLLFFNPMTTMVINIPNCESFIDSVIFICAPTSNSCLVFGLTKIKNNEKVIGVNTFRLGETKWKNIIFRSPEYFFIEARRVRFSGGLFYCFGGLGSVAVFGPSNKSWVIHKLQGEVNTHWITMWVGAYLVEANGEFFILQNCGDNPLVFKLNSDEVWFWEEKKRFDEGLTIFGARLASESILNLTSNMRNKLFLSNSYHSELQTYFFDEERYLPIHSPIPYWKRNNIFQTVWVSPPRLLLDLI